MEKVIEIIKYIIIGIVQGISEIFPISSSGHLSLVYFAFNINEFEKLNLTIFVHLASCLALCVFYKKEIKELIIDFFSYLKNKDISKKDNYNFLLYLVIATIPSVIVGLFLKPIIEKSFNDIKFIVIGFILTSILLLYNPNKNLISHYTFKNTFITGLFQSFALLPGLSRSGTTLFGSKIAKLNNVNGKKLTMFLLIPISIGSTILSFFDINNFNSTYLFLYTISFIVTFLITLISLKLFVNKFTNKHNKFFSMYLMALSLLILIFMI